ncbi:MAG TPA: hypothetical protein VFW98_12005 [Gemmatimonadaceae bacterium]|nr:hypothetical protein [Gemmatimonadaceae bacterium]
MATKLEKTLKREIEIDGQAYMVAISPDGVKLTQKGFRKGPELTWKQILASGGGSAPAPAAEEPSSPSMMPGSGPHGLVG